jgi:hypothetical protein
VTVFGPAFSDLAVPTFCTERHTSSPRPDRCRPPDDAHVAREVRVGR